MEASIQKLQQGTHEKMDLLVLNGVHEACTMMMALELLLV